MIKKRIELGLRIIGQSNSLIVKLKHRLPRADKLGKELAGQGQIEGSVTITDSQTTKICRKPVDFLLEQPLPTQIYPTIELMEKPGDAAVMSEQAVAEEAHIRRHQHDTHIGEFARLDKKAKT